jgi:hypothetical protein
LPRSHLFAFGGHSIVLFARGVAEPTNRDVGSVNG